MIYVALFFIHRTCFSSFHGITFFTLKLKGVSVLLFHQPSVPLMMVQEKLKTMETWMPSL